MSVMSRCVAMVLLLACVCAVTATPNTYTPKTKWHQNMDTLTLKLKAACKPESVSLSVTPSSVHFSCVTSVGLADLKFQPREDVDPDAESNGCVRRGVEMVCTVAKAEAHFFDQLATPDDQAALKQYLNVDWARWQEDPEKSKAPGTFDELPYDAATDEYVVPLRTVAELDAAVEEHGTVVVEASFPWCSVCGQLRRQFVSMAKRLAVDGEAAARGSPPLFARVDFLETRELAHRYQAKCASGFQAMFGEDVKPCGLLVLSSDKDDDTVFVEERDTSSELFDTLAGYVGDVVKSIGSVDDLEAFKALSDVTIFGAFSSTDSEEYAAFAAVAKALRGAFLFGATVDEEVAAAGGVATPGIMLFKPEADGERAEWPDAVADVTSDAVNKWAQMERRGLISEYQWTVRDELETAGVPVAHVFVDDESDGGLDDPDALQAVLEPFRAAAIAYRGKIVFLYFKKSVTEYIKDEFFGVADKTFPSFGISETFAMGAKNYALPTSTPLTAESVHAFCADFLAGKLKPTYKSEPLPPGGLNAGMVNTVVQQTLADAEFGTPGAPEFLVALHKPWGEKLDKAVGPILARVASGTSGVPGFYVGQMDATANYVDKDMFPGFEPAEEPVTVYLVSGKTGRGKKLKVKSQGRLLTSLKRNSRVIGQHWDMVKEAVRAASAAVKARKDEVKRRKASEPHVPLTDDGGVTKQIVAEGAGGGNDYDRPKRGQTVLVHYTGRLTALAPMTEGKKFDSSRDRGEPFDFRLGMGDVIDCWDIGLATMVVGERAVLTCKSTYAYGEHGSPPVIPPDSTLKFDVELLGFEGSPLPVDPGMADLKKKKKKEEEEEVAAGDADDAAEEGVEEDVEDAEDAEDAASHSEL